MFKRISALVILLTISNIYAVVVNCNAYLEEQTNHIGIKILFTARLNDCIELTKLDENGNSTNINDNTIVYQEPYFNSYPPTFNPITYLKLRLKYMIISELRYLMNGSNK